MQGIDGWWVAVDGELGGVALPAEVLPDLAFRFSNGTFRFGVDEGRVVLNALSRPEAIDLISTRGPNRGRVVPAIIELTATSLRICCDLSGTCRPRAFRAPAGTRRFLATYRRARHMRLVRVR
jgi:uncharacterized protein (TIGR03067 family)